MITWFKLHPQADLGMLPYFLWERDPRPAREQFNERYQHGGGWQPMAGWTYSPHTHRLQFADDPAMVPVARAELRDEQIFLYPSAWVVIQQPSGAFEVARMD